MFDIRREDGTPVVAHLLSLTPFRRIVKDYFMICDSYYQAIRTATTDKIEAIDMGRRGIHDEGSRTLQERLKRQGADRLRNFAAAVHADLRAALEGAGRMTPKSAERFSRTNAFVCPHVMRQTKHDRAMPSRRRGPNQRSLTAWMRRPARAIRRPCCSHAV